MLHHDIQIIVRNQVLNDAHAAGCIFWLQRHCLLYLHHHCRSVVSTSLLEVLELFDKEQCLGVFVFGDKSLDWRKQFLDSFWLSARLATVCAQVQMRRRRRESQKRICRSYCWLWCSTADSFFIALFSRCFCLGTSKESGRRLPLPRRLRVGLDVRWYLLDWLIVVLEVAILEKDKIVVFVGLDAVLAKSVRALVARPLYLFMLVAWLLAVGDSVVARRLPQHGALGAYPWRHPVLDVRYLLVSTHLLSRQGRLII